MGNWYHCIPSQIEIEIFLVVGQLCSSGIVKGFKHVVFCFHFQMEAKGIETTKNNAGPAASQETQVSKPKSGEL